MSILNQTFRKPSESEIAAKQLVGQAVITFNYMAKSFNDGAKNFWQNPKGISPQEIADKLGTNAKEVFELHYALGQLLGNIKPEAIQEGLSVIGNFTINNDGTVTVNNN